MATATNDKTQQAGNDTQMARRVSYRPTDPVGSAGGLKSLLEAARDSIAQALPRHVTPERIIKTLLVAANRNADILQCTQASVFECINRAAELGLDLSGTLGEAYPVPFNNKVGGQWKKQLTLIIGYRGLEKLAWQSGEVTMIDAEVVYSNDHFVFKKGFDPVLEFHPCITGDRGEPIGAYALIITKEGGRMARFMPKDDIEKIRKGAVSGNSPAWRNHWDEMARKTALRRVLKDAPLSTEKLVAALEHDNADYNLADVLSAQTGGGGIDALPAGRHQMRASDQDQPEPEAGEPSMEQEPGTDAAPASDDGAGEAAGDQDQDEKVKKAQADLEKKRKAAAEQAQQEAEQEQESGESDDAAQMQSASEYLLSLKPDDRWEGLVEFIAERAGVEMDDAEIRAQNWLGEMKPKKSKLSVKNDGHWKTIVDAAVGAEW